MDQLKEELIRAAMRFKRMHTDFTPEIDINMNEFFLLKGISQSPPCSDKSFRLADIHSHLQITKPAVSQMLNSLERRGYILREIDRNDRRKISITLTDKGREILKVTKKHMERKLDMTISMFGEENTRQLINSLTLLADIVDKIQKEKPEGDNRLD